VVRNRVKRILRAAYREFEAAGELKHGYLVVLNARNAAVDAKSTDIVRELRHAFRKTELLRPRDGEAPSDKSGTP
jgi:ribonuclease P protein component